MWSMLSLLLMTSLPVFHVTTARLQIFGMRGKEVVLTEAVSAVLAAVKEPGIFIILVVDRNMLMAGVGKLGASASLGAAVFELTVDSLDVNSTQPQISLVIEQARQMVQVSRFVTVVVMSNDPAFLSVFIQWSRKGRLLVWSTRLLVLTCLQLHQMRFLETTLSMTNSMLMLQRHTPLLRYDVYVYQPYSSQDVTPLLAASWIEHEVSVLRHYHRLFPEKFNILSEGPRLLVTREEISITRTKAVDDPDAPGGKRLVILSAKFTLLETIAQSMNFTFDFIAPPDGDWGIKLRNNSWTGMMGMVARGEVDIGLGLYGISAERAEAVDFTFPVAVMYGRLIAGRSNPEVDPWGVLLPLGPIVWMAILASLFGAMLILELLSCMPVKLSRQTTSFSSIRVLLQQDINMDSVSGWWWCERVLVGVWMLATLVLTRSYAGNLMSLLAVRYIPMPIQSLQDIVDNPITFLVQKGTVKTQAFLMAESGILHDIGNLRYEGRLETISAKDLVEKLGTLVRHGGYVQMGMDYIAMLMIAQDFSLTGRCDFYLSKDEFLPLLVGMAGPKGSPLLPAMDRRIIRVIEAGLYNYWNQLYTPNFTACLNPLAKIAVGSSLNLSSIWGILVILAGGMTTSIIVLGLEHLKHRVFR